jgi:Na+/proline symporter
MPSVPTISPAVLGAAFVPWLLVVGFLTYKAYNKTKSFDDYNIAKGHWGPVVLGFSAAATMQSAATILGVPGLVYGAGGFPGLWLLVTKSLAFGFGMIVFAKVLQHLGDRFGSLSVADWLGHMYESDAIRVIAALLATFQIAWVIAQLAGASQVISALTTVSYEAALVISVLITFGYVFIGGESATQLTDTFQGVLMLIVVAASMVAGLFVLDGGIASLPQQIQSQGGNMGLFASDFAIFAGPFAVFSFAMFFVTGALNPAVGKKFMSLDSNSDIKLFLVTAIGVAAFMDFTAFAGLYAVALFPGLEQADQSILYILNLAYPAVLVSVFAVAIFSATVTTLNSVIVSISVSYSNDIYRRVLAKRGIVHSGKSDAQIDTYATWISRGGIVVLAVVSGLFALTPPDYINIFVNAGNYGFTSSVAPVVAIGAIWRKANSTGAVTTLVVGPLLYLYLYLFQTPSNPFIAGTITLGVTVVTMVTVSYLSQGTPTRALRMAPSVQQSSD